MKKLAGLLALALMLAFATTSVTFAAGEQMIKGDLLKIEGEFYVVKDAAGKEVRLHVDKTTKMEGAVKEGDKIEAQATDKGHAMSIKPSK
jgi:hypothetical protein